VVGKGRIDLHSLG